MRAAIEKVRDSTGREYDLMIGANGSRLTTRLSLSIQRTLAGRRIAPESRPGARRACHASGASSL